MSLSETLNVVQNTLDRLSRKPDRRKTFRELEQTTIGEGLKLQKQIEEASREVESLDEACRAGKAAILNKLSDISDRQSEIERISEQLETIRTEIANDEEKLASYVDRKLKAKSVSSRIDLEDSENAKTVLRAFCHLTGVRWDTTNRTASAGYIFNAATNQIKLFHVGDCSREKATEKIWAAIEQTSALPIEQ